MMLKMHDNFRHYKTLGNKGYSDVKIDSLW